MRTSRLRIDVGEPTIELVPVYLRPVNLALQAGIGVLALTLALGVLWAVLP